MKTVILLPCLTERRYSGDSYTVAVQHGMPPYTQFMTIYSLWRVLCDVLFVLMPLHPPSVHLLQFSVHHLSDIDFSVSNHPWNQCWSWSSSNAPWFRLLRYAFRIKSFDPKWTQEQGPGNYHRSSQWFKPLITHHEIDLLVCIYKFGIYDQSFLLSKLLLQYTHVNKLPKQWRIDTVIENAYFTNSIVVYILLNVRK